MEGNALMRVALVMLGLAAVGSVCIAVMRLSGVPRAPDWLTTGYGVLAWLGLALVCLVALTAGIPAMAQFALAPFLLASASDSVLNRLLHRNRLPSAVAVLRAFFAGVGFVLLLVAIYGQMYVAKLPVPTMIHTG
jgi:hypothetical protein